jgi:hypothetical protein
MRLFLAFGFGLLTGASFLVLPRLASHAHAAMNAVRSGDSAKSAAEATHTERTFEFTAKAPMEIAAPLFGADKERAWAPGWNPTFLWPADAKDRQGMVFTVAHGHKTAIWINTAYDPATGSIQYAYVIPEIMTTLITLKLTPQDKWTHVAVQYQRTALNTAAKDTVLEVADHDSKSGPEWENQINDYLAALPKLGGIH